MNIIANCPSRLDPSFDVHPDHLVHDATSSEFCFLKSISEGGGPRTPSHGKMGGQHKNKVREQNARENCRKWTASENVENVFDQPCEEKQITVHEVTNSSVQKSTLSENPDGINSHLKNGKKVHSQIAAKKTRKSGIYLGR